MEKSDSFKANQALKLVGLMPANHSLPDNEGNYRPTRHGGLLLSLKISLLSEFKVSYLLTQVKVI